MGYILHGRQAETETEKLHVGGEEGGDFEEQQVF